MIWMFWPSFSLQASQVQKRNWASQSDKQRVPILARTTLAFGPSVCMSECRYLIHQGNSNTHSPCERCLMLQSLSIERCASISCTNKETSRTRIGSLPNAVANLWDGEGMEKQKSLKKAWRVTRACPKKIPRTLNTVIQQERSFTIIHSGSVLRSGSLEAKPWEEKNLCKQHCESNKADRVGIYGIYLHYCCCFDHNARSIE